MCCPVRFRVLWSQLLCDHCTAHSRCSLEPFLFPVLAYPEPDFNRPTVRNPVSTGPQSGTRFQRATVQKPVSIQTHLLNKHTQGIPICGKWLLKAKHFAIPKVNMCPHVVPGSAFVKKKFSVGLQWFIQFDKFPDALSKNVAEPITSGIEFSPEYFWVIPFTDTSSCHQLRIVVRCLNYNRW